jgi:hypothetical protein
MTKPIHYESLVEPLNDEERQLMDPDTWAWDSAEERPPVANPGIVLEIRFSREAIRRVATAAVEAGVPVEASIARAALTSAAQGMSRQLPSPQPQLKLFAATAPNSQTPRAASARSPAG